MANKKLTQEKKDKIDAEWHTGNSPELEEYLFKPVVNRTDEFKRRSDELKQWADALIAKYGV